MLGLRSDPRSRGSRQARLELQSPDLIQRISSQNPHLYQRDIEKIVSKLCVAETEWSYEVSERFRLSSGERARGGNPRTGAVVPIAQKAVPSFKTGKEMRQRLNPDGIGGLTE